MPYECYIPKKFHPKTLSIIDDANDIIDDYKMQGFTLTLRQLYYQFVARDLLQNSQQNYDKLGQIINNARLAGLIDWKAIEDRTRNLEENPHWENPEEIIKGAAQCFALDKWETQPTRVEVWIEKDALTGIIERPCKKYDVPYFACRGYNSQSEQWKAGQRFIEYENQGQGVIILHLGDHDPSGIHMTQDNDERLRMYAGWNVVVDRIALNMDQVNQYNPPPNFAKMTDTRTPEYIRKYGMECWELDALDPSVIENLVEAHITTIIDDKQWKAVVKKEKQYIFELKKAEQNWPKIRELMKKFK